MVLLNIELFALDYFLALLIAIASAILTTITGSLANY